MQLEVHRSRLRKQPRPPRISVNPRTGVIVFSRKAVEKFGIRQGQKLAFAEDKDSPGEWYILPADGPLTVCTITPRLTVVHQVKSRRLAQDIVESIGMDGCVYIPLGSMITVSGVRAIPLLVRDAVKRNIAKKV